MEMIPDQDGKLRAILSARLNRLAFGLVRNGTTGALPETVDAELARVLGKVEPEDLDRYHRIAEIAVQLFLAVGDKPQMRTLRQQRTEAERYLGFTKAAEALHGAQSLEDFQRLLPQVDLGRTYGCSDSPISPFPLGWTMSARGNVLPRVQAMLDAGAPLDLATKPHEFTILHEMAMAGAKGWEKRLSLLRLLVRHGANLEARDRFGRTPLLCAIGEGSLDDMRLFLAAGSDVRACAEITTLMFAADNPAKMLLLLDSGADPQQKAADGRSLSGYLRNALLQAEDWLNQQPMKKRAGSVYERLRDARAASLALIERLLAANGISPPL
jgi:hypothetical protein